MLKTSDVKELYKNQEVEEFENIQGKVITGHIVEYRHYANTMVVQDLKGQRHVVRTRKRTAVLDNPGFKKKARKKQKSYKPKNRYRITYPDGMVKEVEGTTEVCRLLGYKTSCSIPYLQGVKKFREYKFEKLN